MSAVEPLALQVFDAGRAVVFVEQHPGDERVELDPQAVWIFLCRFQRALARAHPRVPARCERRVAHTHCVLRHQPPVVGISLRFDEVEKAFNRLPDIVERLVRRLEQYLHQPEIAHCRLWNGALHLQPALPAVPRRVRPRRRQHALEWPVMAVLQPHEISPHVVGIP